MLASSAVGTAFGIAELIVIASWALLFAVLIGVLITVTVMRGRRERRRLAGPPAAVADPELPARLAGVRRADPHFDEQLLLEAAQMACLVAFAAMSSGDEQVIRHMTAPPFWSTFYGKYLMMSARDARRQRRTPKDPDLASSRQTRIPVDYQATAPELISLELGPPQLARVRISFNQLRVIVAPGAGQQAAAASATSLGQLASSFGGAIGQRLADQQAVPQARQPVVPQARQQAGPQARQQAGPQARQQAGPQAGSQPGVSWVSWAGQYDLVFARPGGALTDPNAAVASRTCTRCGATYRSELDTACAHCHAARPLAWGMWRLESLTPIDG